MNHLTDFQVISSLTGAKEDASKELLRSAGSLNGVFRMAHEELTKYLTKGQAQKVLAAKEISKRKSREEVLPLQIKSSHAAAMYLIDLIGNESQEHFHVLFLDRKNSIKSEKTVSIGSISSCLVDVRVIMKEAVLQLASSIIVSHNHPSGNTRPSQADIEITKKIKEAARLFDMEILDHIIVTDKTYYSFADSGTL